MSIRRVAQLAGVSTATVSRALKNPEVVADATREAVLAAVARLGYTPNFLARNLRTLKSHVVLALVPDIGNPFFSEIIKGMEQVAHQHGYSLLLGDTHDDPAREMEYASRVTTRQADGLVTLSSRVPFKNYKELIKRRALPPMVNACECVSDSAIPTVQIDNEAAALKAMQYLLDLGHRRIGFVTGPLTSRLSNDRLKGYANALARAGIVEREQLIAVGDFTAESGVAAAETFLAMKQPPTAVFCSNDEMAIGLCRTLRARQVRIPEQISVVGFDDIPLARYFDPPLTTILQPKMEIGREAMRMLCGMLAGMPPAKPHLVLPYQLVVRDSTGRAATSR